MAHKLDKVTGKMVPEQFFANQDYTLKFTVRDENDDVIDISGDSLTFLAYDRIAESQIFSVNCTITDASNGKCTATISSSDNDTATEAIFELKHDVDDDGNVDGRVQWKQEIRETV